MISLMDHVRKKDLPPELKCRQVCASRLGAVIVRGNRTYFCLAYITHACLGSTLNAGSFSCRSSLRLDYDPQASGVSLSHYLDRSARGTDPSIILVMSQHF